MDRRARQFVPLYVHFSESKLGVALKKEFGAEGLAVWICLLAAAKRNLPQGSFRYSSESDAWAQLGLLDAPPNFTFEAFLKVTGRMKQTSRTSSGHLSNVVCTQWQHWNDEFDRQKDRERKSRKRAENTRTQDGTSADDPPTMIGPNDRRGESPLQGLSLPQRRARSGRPAPLAPVAPVAGYHDLADELRAAYPQELLEHYLHNDPTCAVRDGRIYLDGLLLGPPIPD